MRYEDLPAAARAQVDAKLGRRRGRTTSREATIGEHGPGLPLRCTRCAFTAQPATGARLEAHQAATGHGRFEWRASAAGAS